MVRHVYWVERIVPEIVAARQTAATDPPKHLRDNGGEELMTFRADRDVARSRVKALEELIYPGDA